MRFDQRKKKRKDRAKEQQITQHQGDNSYMGSECQQQLVSLDVDRGSCGAAGNRRREEARGAVIQDVLLVARLPSNYDC